MEIFECFETEAFNELTKFPFEEVRKVFNQYPCYVPESDAEPFVADTSQLKSWYANELNKVDEYAKGEYEYKLRAQGFVEDYEEPSYMAGEIEDQAKAKIVEIIEKYFNRNLYQSYKGYMFGPNAMKAEVVETPHQLYVSLLVYKKHIYSLLSIIGYYHRNRGYFLSRSDYYKICCEYSNEVYQINKSLGMRRRFVDIFLSDCRIHPSSGRIAAGLVVDEDQNNDFIDVDKISLVMLIQPYLTNNTQEINKIIEIMQKNLRGKHGGLAWRDTLKQVQVFIAECEAKGIMKRLI